MEVNYLLLREMIRNIALDVLTEKRAKKGKKPGGGLTDLGAQYHLDKATANRKAALLLRREEGDVEDAAQSLGVSKRTLYKYIQDNPPLKRAKERAERDTDGKLVSSGVTRSVSNNY